MRNWVAKKNEPHSLLRLWVLFGKHVLYSGSTSCLSPRSSLCGDRCFGVQPHWKLRPPYHFEGIRHHPFKNCVWSLQAVVFWKRQGSQQLFSQVQRSPFWKGAVGCFSRTRIHLQGICCQIYAFLVQSIPQRTSGEGSWGHWKGQLHSCICEIPVLVGHQWALPQWSSGGWSCEVC